MVTPEQSEWIEGALHWVCISLEYLWTLATQNALVDDWWKFSSIGLPSQFSGVWLLFFSYFKKKSGNWINSHAPHPRTYSLSGQRLLTHSPCRILIFYISFRHCIFVNFWIKFPVWILSCGMHAYYLCTVGLNFISSLCRGLLHWRRLHWLMSISSPLFLIWMWIGIISLSMSFITILVRMFRC